MRREEEDGVEHGESGGFGRFIYRQLAPLSLSLVFVDAVGGIW
jgi:hypothetical protein